MTRAFLVAHREAMPIKGEFVGNVTNHVKLAWDPGKIHVSHVLRLIF